ncbi:MAG TPA: tetratricopeptide repeat protein [Xanthobacteraceae bacterium]
MAYVKNAAMAYFFRAVAYESKGDLDDAIADLGRHIRLVPSDADGAALRAKIIAARRRQPADHSRW